MPKISELPTDAAPAIADLIPFVDVDAVRTEAVTVDNLAASTAFSGRYVAFPTQQWELSDRFAAIFGTAPSFSYPDTVGMWLMDASAAEYVATLAFLPDWASTYDATIVWVNRGAGAGNVRWEFFYGTIGDADAALSAAGGLTVQQTATAGATDVRVDTAMISGLTCPTNGILRTYIGRVAGDGADTLANDAGFVGLVLTLHP